MESAMKSNMLNCYNLPYVIRFEQLMDEFTLSMIKTTQSQQSFWFHLQDPMILDYNLLDKDNENIYNEARKTESLWGKIYKINSCYEPGLVKYTDYLKNIRNDEGEASKLIEYMKNVINKKGLDLFIEDNKILFDSQTAIFQISGSKITSGEILKTNKGAIKLFEYSEIELLHYPVNKLMPNLISRKHASFMEHYFKTGKSRMMNKRRCLFANSKDGYCFRVAIFIREMPWLYNDGLQYVGMISHPQIQSFRVSRSSGLHH